MTAFLIVSIVLWSSATYFTLRTKPEPPYGVLVFVFCLQASLVVWAFLLLLNIWEQGL